MRFTYFSFIFLSSLFAYSQQVDSLVLQPGALIGKDAWVWSYVPGSNQATNSEALLAAWTHSGAPSNKRFYVQFDLSTIPTGTSVDSAFLFLSHNPNTISHGGVHTGTGNSFYVRGVTSSWTETGITWNNQPSVTNTDQITVPSTSVGNQNFKIDVTTLTQNQLNTSNYGYCLKLTSETTYKAIVCASSDHSTAALRPMLKVYFNSCSLPEVGYDFQINNTTVTFLDTSISTNPYGWIWDFGDGSFSNQHNPTKSYTSPGVYNTCLILTDSCGTDTLCQQLILCAPPQSSPQYQIAGTTTVQFTGLPNNANSYFWDFGDGNFSIVQSPIYTYTNPGTYTSCLTIIDSCGIDTSCVTIGVPNIGIDEWNTSLINVYPNPSTNQFIIELSETIDGTLEIYSISGQRVYDQNVNGEPQLELNLELPEGTYILQLKSNSKTLKERIVIQ